MGVDRYGAASPARSAGAARPGTAAPMAASALFTQLLMPSSLNAELVCLKACLTTAWRFRHGYGVPAACRQTSFQTGQTRASMRMYGQFGATAA